MISTRSYLVRAIRDWSLDSGLTPHILVDAAWEGVVVPEAYVENGQITLNVSARAIQAMEITPEHVSFQARFNGREVEVYVPVDAVLAVYAQENGQGIVFEEPHKATAEGSEKPAKGGPHLKLVE